ncbi:MAG TPA: hypothetical protein VHN82_07800 [Methanoregula sp.]|nr:hypothetical protein [Methanoregula sp.]
MKRPDSFRYGFGAIVLLAAIALTVFPAAAHPPSDIQLAYNDVTQQLAVTINHPVDDPQTHYIRFVQVKVNDVIPITADYTSQPSKGTFTYTYSIPLNKGDTIRVTATCIQGPSLTAVMNITLPAGTPVLTKTPALAPTDLPAVQSSPATPAPVPVTTQKSALGLLPAIAAAAFVLAKKR